MEKRRFSRKREWPFVPVRWPVGKGWRRRYDQDRDENDEIFMAWLVHALRRIGGRNLEPGERLNALALSLNQANLQFLEEHISAWKYLGFSPRADNTLRDGELGVDKDAIYKKEDK